MKKIITTLTIISITSLYFYFWGCKSNSPTSPTNNELTLQEKEQIIQIDSLISLTADTILLTSNPITGWQAKLNNYKSYSNVENAWITNTDLIIKYKKAGFRFWHIGLKKESYLKDIKNDFKNIESDEPVGNGSVLIINTLYNDDNMYSLKQLADNTNARMQNKGFTVTIKNGAEANLNFYRNNLKDYGIIFNISQGAYISYNNDKLHMIQTGENDNSLIQPFLREIIYDNEKCQLWINGEIQIADLLESHSGVQFSVGYIFATEKLINNKYSSNDFPHSFIYLMNCSSFQENNSFGEIFNSKGAALTVGWDAPNCIDYPASPETGEEIIKLMLAGNNFNRSDSLLPQNLKEKNCAGTKTHLKYYPLTGGTIELINTGTLQAPTLISPSNGSINQSLTPILDWSDVSAATLYTVQVSIDPGFTSTIVNQIVTTSSYTIPGGLSNNTLYYWRTNAKNPTNTSYWSNVGSFTTVAAGSEGSWSPLGSGMNESVKALMVYNGELIAGGNFTTAGGVSLNRIAKWNGSSWSSLSTGMDQLVNALIVFNGELIAGGGFTTAGGVSTNKIAKWDGNSWASLGTGIGAMGEVLALTVYNNELIVGGSFTSVGGINSYYIAKWNGSSWDSLGSCMNNSVNALTVYNGELIAGGEFTTAGGISADYIAKWNGNSWSPVGGGMGGLTPSIAALIVYNNTLVAGGQFSTAGGYNVYNIAQWNGNFWTELGSGLNATVRALTIYNEDLITCGDFTTAGGNNANYISKWNSRYWSPLGSGMNSYVSVLTVYGVNLIAGGSFTTAGGVDVNFIAKWH